MRKHSFYWAVQSMVMSQTGLSLRAVTHNGWAHWMLQVLQVTIVLSAYLQIVTGVHTQVTADSKLNDSPARFPNRFPHSRHRLVVADPSPQIHLLQFAIHKNCKATCPKVENEILNIVHVQLVFTCWKLGPWWIILYSCHNLIYSYSCPNLSLA